MTTRSIVQTAIILVAFSGFTVPTRAQTVNDSVIATVQRFFDAMSARDVSASREVMVMDGQYHRVSQNGGRTSVQRVTFDEYVGTLSSDTTALLERMWEPTVLHHGPVAVLWTNYDFYRGGDFSHCGVDAFHVVRTNDGWKISSVVFTIERQECPASPLGPPGDAA